LLNREEFPTADWQVVVMLALDQLEVLEHEIPRRNAGNQLVARRLLLPPSTSGRMRDREIEIP
jgi:hypothetical protein